MLPNPATQYFNFTLRFPPRPAVLLIWTLLVHQSPRPDKGWRPSRTKSSILLDQCHYGFFKAGGECAKSRLPHLFSEAFARVRTSHKDHRITATTTTTGRSRNKAVMRLRRVPDSMNEAAARTFLLRTQVAARVCDFNDEWADHSTRLRRCLLPASGLIPELPSFYWFYAIPVTKALRSLVRH